MKVDLRILALGGLVSASACALPGEEAARTAAATGAVEVDRQSLLVGGEWIVEDINGGGIIDNSRASLTFGDDGRVSGSSSCNSYGADYALTEEGLRIGQAISTQMACAPALMDQERKFFGALATVSAFTIDETGALILTAPGGGRILARR